MKENKALIKLIAAVVFVICLVLITVGQKSIGVAGLAQMLIGLAGLLVLMWAYNRQYQ